MRLLAILAAFFLLILSLPRTVFAKSAAPTAVVDAVLPPSAPEPSSAPPVVRAPQAPPQQAPSAPGPALGLLFSLQFGLIAAALTLIARARASTALLANPPLNCNLCCAFWGSALATLTWWVALDATPTSGIVLWFLTLFFGAVVIAYTALAGLARFDR